ncbi:uncharacterized protein LOC144925179 [Branchiostoma floridae x Branchiostoma belcheri]
MKTVHALLLSSVLTLLVCRSSAEMLPYQQRLAERGDRAQLDDEISTPYDDVPDVKEAAYWLLWKTLLENSPGRPAHARNPQNVMDTDEESRESLRTTVVQRAAKRWKGKCSNSFWKFCQG